MPTKQPAGSKRRHKLDMARLPENLGFHVRLAHVAIYRDFIQTLGAIDLTPKQCSVLILIGANEGLSQIDIAEAIAMDRSTTMALIKRLERYGLIELSKSVKDGRKQELHLTQKGATTIADANEAIKEHEARLKARLTDEEVEVLYKALPKIHGQTW